MWSQLLPWRVVQPGASSQPSAMQHCAIPQPAAPHSRTITNTSALIGASPAAAQSTGFSSQLLPVGVAQDTTGAAEGAPQAQHDAVARQPVRLAKISSSPATETFGHQFLEAVQRPYLGGDVDAILSLSYRATHHMYILLVMLNIKYLYTARSNGFAALGRL